MKPIRVLFPVAAWIFRISAVMFAWVMFYSELKTLSFDGLHYFVGLLFSLFSLLLFFGGFMKKPVMTIFSGLILFLLSAYKIFDLFDNELTVTFIGFIFVAAVSLLFVAQGNKT